MTDQLDPMDIGRILDDAKNLKRIYDEVPAKPAEKPEPTTPGEFAARAIARNRAAQ